MNRYYLAAILVIGSCLFFRHADGAAAEDAFDYNRDIRPILSDKCFFCHGPDANHREADLRLDEEKSAKEWVVVEGKPTESELVRRITSEDEFERMPPPDSGKKLTAQEIERIKQWIAQGAKYEAHWAYVPPQKHPVPQVQNSAWSEHWIDRFLMARWEKENVKPSPDADPVTLIRRLHFDLTGLPPAPEDVEKFLKEPGEKAYEEQVDRLLNSDHFGERMAVYWLDLVRYADTVGYHGDQDHHISPYRDYVIDAFNDNLPFDQFTREQLAGDLLPDSTIDQKIASGYNRMLQTSHEGGVQEKEYLAIYGADRVRNVSNVWMGATVGCAQCHDHKYDPYTAKDFYSLQAFFADLDEAQHLKKGSDSVPTSRLPELKVLTKRERAKLASLEEQIAALKNGSAGSTENEKRMSDLRQQAEAIRDSARLTMISVSIEPRTIRLLPRGNWLDDSGPIVQPAVPHFLTQPEGEHAPKSRLDLANWLCDTEKGTGGLTARVFVNRMWHLLFGVGISRSLDDFGGQGEPPVHPELLDRLALEFTGSGWDVKQILKQIVMSRAYKQSSVGTPEQIARDPNNRLYARQSRFRLSAEFVRDNALAISGLLDRTIGGPSVKPYQPAGYWAYLNFPRREWMNDRGENQYRRGLYTYWQRSFIHPSLLAFDAPTREECTVERTRSNTPQQALVLLNDPTYVEASRAFAVNALREGGKESASRIEWAYRHALGRAPRPEEAQVLTKLVEKHLAEYRADPKAAEALCKVGDFPLPKDLSAPDVAAWTSVTRVILNLHETITRE